MIEMNYNQASRGKIARTLEAQGMESSSYNLDQARVFSSPQLAPRSASAAPTIKCRRDSDKQVCTRQIRRTSKETSTGDKICPGTTQSNINQSHLDM